MRYSTWNIKFVLNILFMTVVHSFPGKLFTLLDFLIFFEKKESYQSISFLVNTKKTWIVNSFCMKIPRAPVVILNNLKYILNNKYKLNNTTFIVTDIFMILAIT